MMARLSRPLECLEHLKHYEMVVVDADHHSENPRPLPIQIIGQLRW
jgi:hypothetical protein